MALQHIVTYGFVPLVIQFITAGAVAATLGALDARLGLLGLAIVPLLILWTIWSSERVRRRAHGLASADSTLYATVSEVLGSIRAVKSFAMEDVEQHRFETRARASQQEYVSDHGAHHPGRRHHRRARRARGDRRRILRRPRRAPGRSHRGRAPGLRGVSALALRAHRAPRRDRPWSSSVRAASVERVVQILDEENERGQRRGGRLARVSGGLRYENVAFGYEEAQPALQGVSLEIGPGQRVAFVGRSGAGGEHHPAQLACSASTSRRRDGSASTASTSRRSTLQWLRRTDRASSSQEPIIFSPRVSGRTSPTGGPAPTDSDVMQASQAAGAPRVGGDAARRIRHHRRRARGAASRVGSASGYRSPARS